MAEKRFSRVAAGKRAARTRKLMKEARAREAAKVPTIVVVTPEGKVHGPRCACMVCPNCGATEIEDCTKPISEWRWQIRPFKVDNYSHCLKCDSWF